MFGGESCIYTRREDESCVGMLNLVFPTYRFLLIVKQAHFSHILSQWPFVLLEQCTFNTTMQLCHLSWKSGFVSLWLCCAFCLHLPLEERTVIFPAPTEVLGRQKKQCWQIRCLLYPRALCSDGQN